LTKNLMARCKLNLVRSKDKELVYEDKLCAVFFFDLFHYFSGLKKHTQLYPLVKEDVDETCKAVRQMILAKEAIESNFEFVPRVCPHCKLREDQLSSYYTVHTERCKLEQKSCGCGLAFKTPKEKHRHMKLHHSSRKYIQCPKCDEIFGDNDHGKKGLQNHMAFNHGTGKEVCCEICRNPFKNENRLRVHRLNHELYYCQICNIEILGRNSHKSHVMKKHGSGLHCDACDRVFLKKKELDVHKKHVHATSWKK